MKDKPFALIGVNSDSVDRAKKAVADNELNWRSFQNQPEGARTAIADDWAVRGWPTVVVLDHEMRIHYRGHDARKATDIAKRLVTEIEAKDQGDGK